MYLSDVSNKQLIKEIKANPNNTEYIAELINRMDNNAVSDVEFIKVLDLVLSIVGG